MSERDAFGREKGDDPVQSMGWGDSGVTSNAKETPAVVVQVGGYDEAAGTRSTDLSGVPGSIPGLGRVIPERAGLPSGAPTVDAGSVLRRLLGGCLPALIVLVIVGAVAVNVVSGLVDSVDDSGVIEAIDDLQDLDTPPVPAPVEDPGAPSAPAAEPTDEGAPAVPPRGFDRDSLLLRRNFAAALERLGGQGYGRLLSLRVAPDRINALFITDGGRSRMVLLEAGGAVRPFPAAGEGLAGQPTALFSEINTAAPFRAARSAAGRSRVPATAVNYLLYNFAGNRAWNVYLTNGDYYQADARGRITRQISG